MNIHFEQISFDSLSNKINISIKIDDELHFVYFKIKEGYFNLSSRFVAMLVGSICGKNYTGISINFPLPEHYISFLSYFTGAQITVPFKNEVLGLVYKKPLKYCLSFSGGFDSLAAFCLLKNKDVKCVSMDFGGKFKRERSFFEKFDTNIVETNFLESKLQKNHWTFMGIGLLIMSEFYQIENYVFGGIIQNSFINFTKKSTFKNQSIGMFPLAGMKALPVVQGLTEVGTILIILENFSKDEVMKSLFSLSNFKEFKLFRKYLLLCSADYAYYDKEIMESMIPRTKLDISLQKNQGELFLLMFILKNYKGDFLDIQKGFESIDSEILNFTKNNDLSFYGKYNTDVYRVLGDMDIIHELELNGIEPYLDKDFISFSKLTEFLRNFYS